MVASGADATLIELADVLRATLDISELHEAPLSTELRLVRGYARVMPERYSERVDIDWRIDDAALDCMLPVMRIQTLLETIFKHAIAPRRELTCIVVPRRRHRKALASSQSSRRTGSPRPHPGSPHFAGAPSGDAATLEPVLHHRSDSP